MTRPVERPPRVGLLHDLRIRSVVYQALLCIVIGVLAYVAVINAAENLARAHVTSGFAFWNVTAGFEIIQTLIDYSPQTSTFGRAFWVSLLNTLLVSGLGIVLATVLGFVIGIARLSSNFLVERLATGYVESIRNVPLLLQLLFWYNAVLKALPDFSNSVALPGGAFLNIRGLYLPRPEYAGLGAVLLSAAAGIAAAIVLRAVLRRHFASAVPGAWAVLAMLAVVLVPPIAAALAVGAPFSFSYPELGRYNVSGGIEVLPELMALLAGLVVYTAAFIAEAVRAGLMAVPKGQSEAAAALGLRRGAALRLVIVPQAMRVIVPPLTNQYLNLTKNSSLAVAIGYPDLVQVFAGTVLNLTGQAVEVVLITMAVYLAISLATSFLMNWYNWRLAPQER